MLNIVSPTSQIHQESAPFTLVGNRGILHEGTQLKHHAVGNTWIYCRTFALSDPREFMGPDKFTDLFFLDEATALAAGHRPCGLCNKERLAQFAKAWKSTHGLNEVLTPEIDAELKVHRVNAKKQVAYKADAAELPAGVMIRQKGRTQPLLTFRYEFPKRQEHMCVYPWTSHGYGVKESLPEGEVEVLTPKPIVEVIRAGFRPGPEQPLLAW